VPAAASSPIPAVLVKLGPLDTGRIADLRPYFDSVPDPRARRGRWYSLTAVLLVCACAVVSGARSIDELAEWGQRASNALLVLIGIRRHLLRWRRTPSLATIGRVLGAVDGDALDRAVGATWPTGTAPPPNPPGRRRPPRPGGHARSLSTANLLATPQHPLGHPMTVTTTPPHTPYQDIHITSPLTPTHCHPNAQSHAGGHPRDTPSS
jgi:hypothetical protein